MTRAAQMLDRCRRHSPAWQQCTRDLEEQLIAALKEPMRVIVLPRHPEIPDDVRRRALRVDPTGRMRSQVRRNLFAASTPRSILAAVEAEHRPRIVTYEMRATETGVIGMPVVPAVAVAEARRRSEQQSRVGRMRQHVPTTIEVDHG